MPNAGMSMQLTSLWSGTVLNRDSHSTERLCCDIAFTFEDRRLAPGTVNLRLGAVRRLAYEASDCGLLSADLAAGIRRVKGVKKIGVRLGNWLVPDQAVALLEAPDPKTIKGKRDLALLALLVACGLRRHEAVGLNVSHLQ